MSEKLSPEQLLQVQQQRIENLRELGQALANLAIYTPDDPTSATQTESAIAENDKVIRYATIRLARGMETIK